MEQYINRLPLSEVTANTKNPRTISEARLQLQERLARDIVNMLTQALDGELQGMAIVMKGTHLCKTMRGVRSQGEMSVSVLTGIFKENAEARREFYKLIDTQKR